MGRRSIAALAAVALCSGLYAGTWQPLKAQATFPTGTIVTDAGSVGLGAAIHVGQLPVALAVNGQHLYVGDAANPVLRDVNTNTGQEAALAGNDGYGYSGDGGLATAAMIQGAGAVVTCGTDTYFSDTLNFVIRKVDGAGHITTVVGNGTYGNSGDGGPATSAQIGLVYGLACIPGSTGPDFPFLFFSDGPHGVVRGLTANGNVVLYVSGLSYPTGIVFDAAANFFIADPGSEIVIRLDGILGTFSILAGIQGQKGYSGDGGAGSAAKLDNPWGLAVMPSTVNYGCGCLVAITDNNNNRVRVVNEHGVINTLAGNGIASFAGDGAAANNSTTELNHPYGLAFDAVSNVLYLADYLNFRVRQIVISTQIITTAAGNGTPSWSGDTGAANLAQMGNPVGVAFDAAGNEYISDNQDNVIREVTASTGNITTVAGIPGQSGFAGDTHLATAALLSDPTGIAVNASGDIFIADTLNQRVRRVDHATQVITTVAGNGAAGFSGDGGSATATDLNSPLAVAVDGAGNLFISDTGNNRVREVSGGIITTYAGNGTSAYAGENGPANAASLNGPLGLAVDSVGNLFISDSLNNRVRRVDHTSFVITLVAGNGTAGLAGDNNLATGASLKFPYGLAVDALDTLYISDRGNQRIRQVGAGGVITSVVATCGVNAGFSGDGAQAAFAQLNSPLGMAAFGTELDIADVNNNRVRHVYGLQGLRVPSCQSPAAAGQTARSANPGAGGTSGTRIPWIAQPAGALLTGLPSLRIAKAAPPAVAPAAPARVAEKPAVAKPAAVAPPAPAAPAPVAAEKTRARAQVVAGLTPAAPTESNSTYLPEGLIVLAVIGLALIVLRRRSKRID
jgi:sugar lactone lactonase YvrE